MKKFKQIAFLFLIAVLSGNNSNAQYQYIIKTQGKRYSISGYPSTGLTGGFHYLNRSLIEFGVAHNFCDIHRIREKDKPFHYTFPFTGFSASLSIDPEKSRINGYMTELWFQMFFATGIQFSHLTFGDSVYNLLKLSIGGEFKGFCLTYGWYLNGASLKEKYARNAISLRYYLPLIRK